MKTLLPADIRLAKKQTKELDSMSDAVLKQKIDAHKRMSAFYAGNDTDEGKVLTHSELILKLVKKMPASERDEYARQNLSLYSRIGVAYANRGLTEKALVTFREGHSESIRQGRKLADGSTGYEAAVQLYELLGQPAPELMISLVGSGKPEAEFPAVGLRFSLKAGTNLMLGFPHFTDLTAQQPNDS